MSLINQVLNQLEQRGAHTSPDLTQIRAVPAMPPRDWIKPLALAAGVLLFASMLAWAWMHRSQHSEPEVKSVATTAAESVAVAPVEAVTPAPASRLSYELSVLPLPDSLRENDIPPTPQTVAERPLVAAITAEPVTIAKPEPPVSPPVITRRDPPQPLKQISPKQQADAEYRKGVQAQQQGRTPEAMAAYEAALKLNEQHEAARLAMAALLNANGQQAAAERILQAGMQQKPLHLSFVMALARLQLQRDQLDQSVGTLQAHLAAADNNADYQAFYAALLQRQVRHKEAVNHFQIALQISPHNGVWRMGYAISLQALDRKEDAKLAYQQALATRTLTPELTAFVQQKLAGL